MSNPQEELGKLPNHLSKDMVDAIYKTDKPIEVSDIDEDIALYQKAIDFCNQPELKERLKDSLIILQQKKIDGIQ